MVSIAMTSEHAELNSKYLK